MKAVVKVIPIEDGLGIILSEEVLVKLHAKVDDILYITETPDGITLGLHPDDISESMKKVMQENYDVLRRLANS